MLRTGKPLSVELGPGIMGSIFDGEYLILVHTRARKTMMNMFVNIITELHL